MRRVVVTGLGVVSPNGIGKEAFWSACVNGVSGVESQFMFGPILVGPRAAAWGTPPSYLQMRVCAVRLGIGGVLHCVQLPRRL